MGLVEQVKSLVSKTSKAAKKASPDAAKTCKVKLADAKKKTKEAEAIAKKAIKVAKDAMKDLEKAKTRKVVVVKLRGKGKKTRKYRGGDDTPADVAQKLKMYIDNSSDQAKARQDVYNALSSKEAGPETQADSIVTNHMDQLTEITKELGKLGVTW